MRRLLSKKGKNTRKFGVSLIMTIIPILIPQYNDENVNEYILHIQIFVLNFGFSCILMIIHVEVDLIAHKNY